MTTAAPLAARRAVGCMTVRFGSRLCLLVAVLAAGNSVDGAGPASAESMTPAQLLEKLIPRVQPKKAPPKNTRRTTRPAPASKPATEAADKSAADKVSAEKTAPTPRPRPDEPPAVAALPTPPDKPEAARRPTSASAEADTTRPIRVGTLAPELGADALAFGPPVDAAPLQPEPAPPLDPALSPLGLVLLPGGALPRASGIRQDPVDATETESEGPPLPRGKPEVVLAAIIPPRASLVPETLAACRAGLSALKIAAKPMPAIQEGACGAPDPFSVSAIEDGAVALQPAATINCEMASTLANWVDDDVQKAAVDAYGSRVTALRVLDSYSCRGRNQIPGAQLSEHAFLNAIDIGAFEIGGRWVTVAKDKDHTDKDTDFIQSVRQAACQRFLTVLGPGSDGYHENHLHLDRRHRGKHGDSRYCH